MGARDDSDEVYVVGLCDLILGESGLPQHKFDWLLGDPGTNGRRARLPVDAFWPGHGLVVEYRELQHDQPTPHFDKPDRLTVSGVHRGEQRALYDTRRDTEIPAHGLRLVVVRPADLDADGRGRLRRNKKADLAALKKILAPDSTRSHSRNRSGSDEERVIDAFRAWLLTGGWTPVDPTDRWTDLEAVRGEERLICEAKGRTSEKGIDADIAYGQLLRRMTSQDPRTRYALAVPSSSLTAAARVPLHVRQLLRIDVYEVTDEGQVRRLST
ncbi:hypothetical protein [Streptomyces tauricus]|uniref:hypothetical protein n=1 Tax=Streptomyces tauricus TaxID=68274 RepID=UPI0022437F89|nr:hypothetical protein [Streptomyces tauricus]MCW8100866.1 hypothetical protein [Streptomyces tauricus]